MLFNWMIWASGILNKPGQHAGNCFDLSTGEGMALFLHEIYHIFQFYCNPIRMLWNYIRSLRDSLVYAKILFAHPYIPFEIEAIAFEDEINHWLQQSELKNSLQKFRFLK